MSTFFMSVPNPVTDARFACYEIQMVREYEDAGGERRVEAVVHAGQLADDYPESVGAPFWTLYGRVLDGESEALCDRVTLTDAMATLRSMTGTGRLNPSAEELDPASVYCAAKSLEEAVRAEAERNGWNLSDLYSGWDGFLRDVVHAATVFETWSCEHVDFNKLGEVWPYYLDDNFGDAVVATVDTTRLRAHFHGDVGAAVCRDIAAKLKLPLNS